MLPALSPPLLKAYDVIHNVPTLSQPFSSSVADSKRLHSYNNSHNTFTKKRILTQQKKRGESTPSHLVHEDYHSLPERVDCLGSLSQLSLTTTTFSLDYSPKKENSLGNRCTCLWPAHKISTFPFLTMAIRSAS